MIAETQELKNRLIATDEEFSRLVKEHSEHENRLQQLTNKSYLTESEQLEEVQLKKRKLFLKDRMEGILQKHRSGTVA